MQKQKRSELEKLIKIKQETVWFKWEKLKHWEEQEQNKQKKEKQQKIK